MHEAPPHRPLWQHSRRHALPFRQGKKKHININKLAGLSRDWGGAKNLFMCFFRVIPYGGEKTHKQNPPTKSRDNPVKILFTCFVLYVFFFAPHFGKPQIWERAQLEFGVTGRKRKDPCTKQCAWRKHGSYDTRLAEDALLSSETL